MKRVFPGILICFLLTQHISAQPFFPDNWRGNVIFKGKEVDEIDLKNYPAGLYIIATDDGRKVKFIVARPD